jgi:hypothetical protein
MSFIAGSGAWRVEQQPGLWQEAYPYQRESDICSKEASRWTNGTRR